MKRLPCSLSVLTLFFCFTPAWAVDMTKIGRTIAKEPAYQTKTPKYCLLVFGPEAKTRVWLVLDGDVLYVDRNGSGDLTEPGKRLPKTNGGFDVGDSTETDGTATRGVLTVWPSNDYIRMYLEVSRGCKQYVGYDPSDRLAFGSRPDEAPIVHFAGPLTLRFYRQPPALVPSKAYCPFHIALGTPGVGKGSFVAVSCCSLPNDVRPIAYVEFPHRDANESPIRVEYVLDGD